MRLNPLAPIAVFSVAAISSTFEPADFNVTKALLDNGVNVTAIPGLAELVERSSSSACSIAVSYPRNSARISGVGPKN